MNYVHLPLFPRLFQVIVRIDDCLALLNLVSGGVGDVSVTRTVMPGKGGGGEGAKGNFPLFFFYFSFILKVSHMQESSEFLGLTRDLKPLLRLASHMTLDLIRVQKNLQTNLFSFRPA